MKRYLLGFLLLTGSVFVNSVLAAQSTADNTQKTAAYFQQISSNPLQLLMFLKHMPKGTDAHIHLWGAAYPEHIIEAAKGLGFCLNPAVDAVNGPNAQCTKQNKLDDVHKNTVVYNKLIDAWSMRNGALGTSQSLLHFFNIFFEQYQLIPLIRAELIADVVNRAARQHESYLELMLSTGNGKAASIGAKVPWNDDLGLLSHTLMKQGLKPLIAQVNAQINKDDAKAHQLMACDTSHQQPGCAVTLRYQLISMRNLPKSQVFAQFLMFFHIANENPKAVGINLVQKENGYYAVQDYDAQMQMIAYLHRQFPKVKIDLHAGELAPNSVPPEALTHHIRDAIKIAHAERIGHGVDIAYEDDAAALLNEMAKQHILVEINLTSNADILGITGKNHPLPLYLHHGVPVAFGTDDEGIFRTDLTREMQRAILTFHLSYGQLKTMIRNSLTYSFVEGKSLWKNPDTFVPVAVCSEDTLGAQSPSADCAKFVQNNLKARLQWQLERQWLQFEASMARHSS